MAKTIHDVVELDSPLGTRFEVDSPLTIRLEVLSTLDVEDS